MRLSSTDIRRFLEEGSLKIVGRSELEFNTNEQIRPSSVDVRISDDFWKFKNYETLEYLDILDIEKARYFKDNPKLIYEQIHCVNKFKFVVRTLVLIIVVLSDESLSTNYDFILCLIIPTYLRYIVL
ncbi:MAG: hypothetical protein V7L04_15495 [Nostoc sp.]|uniref:hypothetical protein n=1 Tax=unclassified Nostoc TaxID=2593658 RepID=UPI00262FDDC6|nr:hypothetical protein [Nostoc sp. S13]MDF5737382.1 hypothetical protein [Nostoc sp. S13]